MTNKFLDSKMIQKNFELTKITSINSSITKLTFYAPEIARSILPGQFINIKIDETTAPLLRRPFSVYYVQENSVEIVFGVMGMGTKKLSLKKVGDTLDVLGPLGKPFNVSDNEELSILVGGGLGAASLPLLQNNLIQKGKNVITFLGARKKEYLLTSYLNDVRTATDDGSSGYHGTVIDLLKQFLEENKNKNCKIYACGPTPMLVALTNLTEDYNIRCEISLETAMACGFGICQGCAVELKNKEEGFALSCVDGPVFNSNEIIL